MICALNTLTGGTIQTMLIKLSFVLLLKPLTWNEVDAANEMICNIVRWSSSADDNRLFDQTACVTKYAKAQVIQQWMESDTGTGQRWWKYFSTSEHSRLNMMPYCQLFSLCWQCLELTRLSRGSFL